MKPAIKTYKQFVSGRDFRSIFRAFLRDIALRALSLSQQIDQSASWIKFPFYHHVFEDEQRGFIRQLKDMKNFGEFISMDAAVELLTGKDPLDGRYFCLSFDDGMKSCVTSALPILNDLQVPCIFYVVTDYMGKTFEAADQVAHNVFNFTSNNSSLEFMTWDDCRTLMDCNMSIGSHSCSHPKMIDLAPADIGSELAVSKAKIEEYLGGTCRHFCVPYGTPGLHYEPEEMIQHVAKAGYVSLATGVRGSRATGSNPIVIERDQLLAGTGNYQHRYFFGRHN